MPINVPIVSTFIKPVALKLQLRYMLKQSSDKWTRKVKTFHKMKNVPLLSREPYKFAKMHAMCRKLFLS